MKKNKSSLLMMALMLIVIISCNTEQKKSSSQNEQPAVQTENVYEWRGLERKGIYYDKDLLKVWPEAGPELVWEYKGIGNGYGSPVFTPNKMYILGELDSLAYLFAFDKSGELLWKRDFGEEWVKN